MILVLGGSGYVGGAFLQLLSEKNIEHRSVARADVNYYDKSALAGLIKDSGAKFLINAAGYTGKPNVDACEIHKADCLTGNAVLPGVLREVCEDNSLPWGHVSSGCIYTGCREDGEGFTEEDAPNFSFRQNNCSFYSGCKALGEETLAGAENAYVWRLRIPFNHQDSPRNYLTKLLRYNRLLEATNSISHLNEFVAACFACWEKQIPAGTYNVTNTGWVTTREVVDLIKKHLQPDKEFDFFSNEGEFMDQAAKTPRSNCTMDNSKLRNAGIEISDVHDAIENSLKNWVSEASA